MTTPPQTLRPADRRLLGLEPDGDDPRAFTFEVLPHLCRTDGQFYGGAALAAALAVGEAATGRPALWSSTQLVATAALGDVIRVEAEVVASGRTVDQVHVRGTERGRLVFNAVGSTATAREGGLHGLGQAMPRVPPPDDCQGWGGPRAAGGATLEWDEDALRIGHHLVNEHREAPMLDASPDRPGHMALWARLRGELAPSPPALTPAGLGFLADMVPIACARACGVAGAGTSLDNSLRIGEPADGEWGLMELDAHVAVGGYGHGHVHLWSPDGRLLATGSQSARLFSIDDFARRRAR
jgi:acyl-CoA thioesterase II